MDAERREKERRVAHYTDQARIAALEQQRDELAAVLREFIDCREIKNFLKIHGKDVSVQQFSQEKYRRRKLLVWEAAKAALAKVQS